MPKLPKSIFLITLVVFFSFIISQKAQAACLNVPISGDYTLSMGEDLGCTFAGAVNGIELGHLTIPEGKTLTINAGQTLIFNPGYSVRIYGSMYMDKTEVGATTTMRKAYICLKDADNDTYPATSTHYDSSDECANVANGYRRSNTRFTEHINGWTYVSDIQWDYNDASASVYPGTECGYGRACDENSKLGTCDAVDAKCLPDSSACAWCGGTSTAAVNVTDGKVCANNALSDPNTSYSCNISNSCSAGSCSGTRYHHACGGGGTCRGDTTHAHDETRVADYGYTLTNDCETTGTTYCHTAWHCQSNRYESPGKRCDSSQTCTVSVDLAQCGGTSWDNSSCKCGSQSDNAGRCPTNAPSDTYRTSQLNSSWDGNCNGVIDKQSTTCTGNTACTLSGHVWGYYTDSGCMYMGDAYDTCTLSSSYTSSCGETKTFKTCTGYTYYRYVPDLDVCWDAGNMYCTIFECTAGGQGSCGDDQSKVCGCR